MSNCRAPIEYLFDDHTFIDPTCCWAECSNERLHQAITKTIGANNLSKDPPQNNDTSTLMKISSVGRVASNDLSYDHLEDHWLKTLDIEDDNYDYLSKEEIRRDIKDYIPSSDGENDDTADEDYEEGDGDGDDDDENFITDDLNYKVAICDVIDNYCIDKTVFTYFELRDLKIKERTLTERGDTGYYRTEDVHKNTYEKIFDVLKPYLLRQSLKILHHCHTTQSNEAITKSVRAYAPKHNNYFL